MLVFLSLSRFAFDQLAFEQRERLAWRAYFDDRRHFTIAMPREQVQWFVKQSSRDSDWTSVRQSCLYSSVINVNKANDRSAAPSNESKHGQ
jgi:hypothetical protein